MELSKDIIVDLLSLGFNRWQKGNMDRLYFDPHNMLESENFSREEMSRIYQDKAFVDVKTGALKQKGASNILECMEDFLSENGYEVLNGRIAEA